MPFFGMGLLFCCPSGTKKRRSAEMQTPFFQNPDFQSAPPMRNEFPGG
jgi:hypothetical protein